jgi:transposase
MDSPLFDQGGKDVPVRKTKRTGGKPRLRVPQRDQVEMHWLALDELLPANHAARIIWNAVCGLDLSKWLGQIRAVEGSVGRDATDPRLLAALWIYAILEGIGSGRELARRCGTDLPFQWLCGKVSVNHHTLSDFRKENGEAWDALLTQIIASLMAEGLVTMKRVAQDGMRVRADAGSSSFRRKTKLETCLDEAREQVETLKRLGDESPDQLSERQRAAQERAAAEQVARTEAALRHCEELQRQREEAAKKSCRPVNEARASTTDPEARNMKFPDGGYRPGYNVQFVTDVDSGLIVDAAVVNAGNDFEQALPSLNSIRCRYGIVPEKLLVDGGFSSKETVEEVTALGTVIYAPLKDEDKQLAAGTDPYARKRKDSPAMADWRARMGTEEAKQIYGLRGQTAEWANAQARNRGFHRMPVRGLKKCGIVARLFAIAHNVVTAVRLRAAAAAA